MGDIVLICFLGLFLLLMFWMMSRMMSSYGNPYGNGQAGRVDPRLDDPAQPTYDDPDIDSRGAFGRDRARGIFPINRRKSGPPGKGRTPGLGSRQDNPNVSSRGSFGRDKE